MELLQGSPEEFNLSPGVNGVIAKGADSTSSLALREARAMANSMFGDDGRQSGTGMSQVDAHANMHGEPPAVSREGGANRYGMIPERRTRVAGQGES